MTSVTLESVSDRYAQAYNLSVGTRNEYRTTLNKWRAWGGDSAVERIGRKEIRFAWDLVHTKAVDGGGANPGRTTNKTRQNLQALLTWACELELIPSIPKFPKPKIQRSVAGRRYLTKPELNALYFASYRLTQVGSWEHSHPIGQ
ncbi:MAG: hypothetical protein R3C53_08370 [Pirellulaceae bacterium]